MLFRQTSITEYLLLLFFQVYKKFIICNNQTWQKIYNYYSFFLLISGESFTVVINLIDKFI